MHFSHGGAGAYVSVDGPQPVRLSQVCVMHLPGPATSLQIQPEGLEEARAPPLRFASVLPSWSYILFR